MAPRYKSIETKHHEERDSFFRDLQRLGRLSRRGFMRVAGAAAGIAAAKGLVTPHGFQLVEVAQAQGAGRTQDGPCQPAEIAERLSALGCWSAGDLRARRLKPRPGERAGNR